MPIEAIIKTKPQEGKIKLDLVNGKDNDIKTRKLRQWITGDPDKDVLDHCNEKPQVLLIDKLTFTAGMACICFTEWLALRHSEKFPQYYYVLFALLMLNRFLTYVQYKMELFMMDFCYFVNLSVICQTWLFPQNLIWFKTNYVLAMGPVLFAIAVWHNKLVFHSIDKLTSFFVHFFPMLLLHLYRWGKIASDVIVEEDSLNLSEWLLYPIAMYIAWQFTYLFITEIILAKELAEDPDIVTSFRYMTTNKKNPVGLLIDVMKKDKKLNLDATKTKLVFIISQLLYTILSILPAKLFYESYWAGLWFISFIFVWGCWNGASYYLEVFSERYNLQFINIGEKEETNEDAGSEKEGAYSDEKENDQMSNASEEDLTT